MSGARRPTLEVGRIVKAHGLKGQVLVDLWTDRSERLDAGTQLLSELGVLVVISSARHQDRYIVTFDRIDSRDEAERWRGVVLSAPRLDDESVIWIDDLFGAEVVDADEIVRGVVVDVEANPASDLLVLDSGALVPLTFVIDVVANERIVVDVPEGLFE
ncbi:MAG: ribosome maturation factor RimM [Acidimicrobiaceae bacterium]|nr:ribosome maturation factor RimM [Acidimicrobiaceae bacterium]